jgi:flagellar biosynthesis/type III secretory pathway protein FliH
MNMISQNLEQRHLNNARLKLQLGEAARLEGAFNEGFKKGFAEGRAQARIEGLKEGKLLGQIILLHVLLGIPQPNPEELSTYTEAQLTELIEQLKCQFRSRGN